MIPQDNPSWLRARLGCLTASRMADAMNFRKDGKPSAERKKLMHDLLAERLTDAAIDHFVTPAMQHGIDTEPEARERYEALSGNLVQPAGFVLHKSIEFFGATPDGLIDSDGLLEVKCPNTQTFIGWRAAGGVPEQHKPQMLAQLACTGRSYVDFVAFDPRIKNPRLQIIVCRYAPGSDELARVEEAAQVFLNELEQMFEVITGREAA